MPQYYPTPGSYSKITGVTPSDTVALPPGTKALLVEGAGNVTVMMKGASTPFLFTGVPAMTTLPIAPLKVMATGTTATNINAMG
jgi:hypothetical protein